MGFYYILNPPRINIISILVYFHSFKGMRSRIVGTYFVIFSIGASSSSGL